MSAGRSDVKGTRQNVAGRRYFNVEQARRALVLVKRIVADIMSRYQRLLELQEIVDAAESAGPQVDSGEHVRREIAAVADKLHAYLTELDDVGVDLRNWEGGVVDFPCIAGGREVRLCWQYGEPRINHWHEVDACPAGRKTIETLPVADRAAVSIS